MLNLRWQSFTAADSASTKAAVIYWRSDRVLQVTNVYRKKYRHKNMMLPIVLWMAKKNGRGLLIKFFKEGSEGFLLWSDLKFSLEIILNLQRVNPVRWYINPNWCSINLISCNLMLYYHSLNMSLSKLINLTKTFQIYPWPIWTQRILTKNCHNSMLILTWLGLD